MKKKALVISLFAMVLWQISGLIPFPVTLAYPSPGLKEIATNQTFIFNTTHWSWIPGTITGCLYFPNIYDSKGERIQTAGGAMRERFIEPDTINGVSFKPKDEIFVKVRANCGIVLGEGMLTVFKPTVFEKSFKVGDEKLTNEDKIKNAETFGNANPESIRMMIEAEEISTQNSK